MTPADAPGGGRETALIQELADILQRKMGHNPAKGRTRRDAQPKSLGVLQANFVIESDQPAALRVAVLARPRLARTRTERA